MSKSVGLEPRTGSSPVQKQHPVKKANVNHGTCDLTEWMNWATHAQDVASRKKEKKRTNTVTSTFYVDDQYTSEVFFQGPFLDPNDPY